MVSGNEPMLWLWRHLPQRCKALFRNNVIMFLYAMRDYVIDPDVIDIETLDCAGVDSFIASLRNFKKPIDINVDDAELMQILHDIESIEGLKDVDTESIPAIVETVYGIITKMHNINANNIANLKMRRIDYILERLL